MYIGNEGSIETACKLSSAPWHPCQPGIHQSSGGIDNTNLQISYNIKVTYCAAGMPAYVRSFALVYVCMLQILLIGTNRISPWCMKFVEDFKGETIPLGCVFFACAYKIPKSEGCSLHVVCNGCGYRKAPGSKWDRQYIVVDIVDTSLQVDTPGNEFRVRPHITEQVCLGKRVCYPSQSGYDKANMIFGGQESVIGRHRWLRTHDFGFPFVTRKLEEQDAFVPEKSDEALEIDCYIMLERLGQPISDDPVIHSKKTRMMKSWVEAVKTQASPLKRSFKMSGGSSARQMPTAPAP